MEKLLNKYLVLAESEVFGEIISDLQDTYTFYTDGKNYLFCVPISRKVMPVLFCAHIDTVRSTTYDEPVRLATVRGTLFNENGILGADDRAGVSGCISISKKYSTPPYLLFTNGEERGGVGMQEFLRDTELLDMHASAIYAVLSLDYKGHNNYALYSCRPDDEFTYKLLTLGYTQCKGTFTDGLLVARHLDVAFANLSIGYANQHSADEFVLLESYTSAVNRAAELAEWIDKKFSFALPVYTPKVIITSPTKPWKDEDDKAAEKEIILTAPTNPKCSCCGRDDRDTRYLPATQTYLCTVCAGVITKDYTFITPETIQVYKEDLERQRKRSREANITLNKAKADITMPSCPKCKDNTNVTWNKNIRGFTCMACHAYPDGGFDGNFWMQGDEKVYSLGDKEVITDQYGTKLLSSFPNGGKHLKQCRICHKYTMNCSTILAGIDKDKPVEVCPTCADTARSTLLSDD